MSIALASLWLLHLIIMGLYIKGPGETL